jgi:hypothetical protein
MQKYLPYHTLLCRNEIGHDVFEGERYKEIENKLRESLGYPRIGERLISETMLLKIVENLCSPRQVIHHYRGKELGGFELDIWVPELLLGIEYQGIQHYESIEHWGGDEGLENRIANDRRKRGLCKDLGYALIEFSHEESITEEIVSMKLRKYIPASK